MEDQAIDVVCQHLRDGTMIPLKLRVLDEDEQYQTYAVRAYRTIPGDGYEMDGVRSGSHIWMYECKILVFGHERRVHLWFDAYENRWHLRRRLELT